MARKKKVIEENLDVSYVKVDKSTACEIVEEGNNELYGRRDCTASHTTIHGIKDVGKDGYYDLVVPFKLQDNADYYLVYVNYDTGDSFGYDRGKVCYVELFQSKDLAKALVDVIYENAEKERSYLKPRQKELPLQITYRHDDGSEQTCYTGTWRGYFETMNYVEMEVVRTDQRYRRGQSY